MLIYSDNREIKAVLYKMKFIDNQISIDMQSLNIESLMINNLENSQLEDASYTVEPSISKK